MLQWLPPILMVLSVIANIVIAYQTKKQVKLTERALKDANKPDVIGYLLRNSVVGQEDSNAQKVILRVENKGSRTARQIKFSGNVSFAPFGSEPISNIRFIKNGITSLVPNEVRFEEQRYLPEEGLNLETMDVTQYQITLYATYEDADGLEYKTPIDLDYSDIGSLSSAEFNENISNRVYRTTLGNANE